MLPYALIIRQLIVDKSFVSLSLLNQMKNGLTEIVFIIDRSGSMAGLEEDTIGGYNALLKKQKKVAGEVIVSTVLFDDCCEVLHDRSPICSIEEMTSEQYYVRGSTALLDAIGGAIHHIGNIHKYAREEDRPEKTLIVITTDGLENSSRYYSFEKIKSMVERQKTKYNWEFLFLGANIDAISTASRLGIQAERAVNYEADSEGTKLNYEVISETVTCFRQSKSLPCAIPVNWKSSIEADYASRHRK